MKIFAFMWICVLYIFFISILCSCFDQNIKMWIIKKKSLLILFIIKQSKAKQIGFCLKELLCFYFSFQTQRKTN